MLSTLSASLIGQKSTTYALKALTIDEGLMGRGETKVSRHVFAMALNLILFHQILRRVPSARAYLRDRLKAGHQIFLDHGALRTVDLGSDSPMNGYASFARILEPLGYQVADIYPLEALKMTGRGFCHVDFPDTLSQFFVSELHTARFSPDFQIVAKRVFGSPKDALTAQTLTILDAFKHKQAVSLSEASLALKSVVKAFSRRHKIAHIDDYQALLSDSKEAAWIATEGSDFNHATDRVADLDAIVAFERLQGRQVKDMIEVSASGRVCQTALKADPVVRRFKSDKGLIKQSVPGSFFEFISRARQADGRLDLRFDSSNAQAIFKMTA